ncbi:MAG: hypothetical protein HYW07_05860 [Candidatus Latescibacteria bacterium]|nr:hypothetical protein [Candidatus Latescibacterota bacterium]
MMTEKQRALCPWNCVALAILGAFTILGYQYFRLGVFIVLSYQYFHMLLLQ